MVKTYLSQVIRLPVCLRKSAKVRPRLHGIGSAWSRYQIEWF